MSVPMVPITDKQALSRKTNKAPSHKRESILKLIDSWFNTKARTALIANMKQNGLTVRMEIGTFKMPPNEKTWYTETRWIVTWKEFTAESLTSAREAFSALLEGRISTHDLFWHTEAYFKEIYGEEEWEKALPLIPLENAFPKINGKLCEEEMKFALDVRSRIFEGMPLLQKTVKRIVNEPDWNFDPDTLWKSILPEMQTWSETIWWRAPKGEYDQNLATAIVSEREEMEKGHEYALAARIELREMFNIPVPTTIFCIKELAPLP